MNTEWFCKYGINRVVAGISGGADSVAMLRLYLEAGIEVCAVHCNFHLRGAESERDRNFVADLCRKLQIDCRFADFDVHQYRRHHNCSVEMACRELRYEYFRKIKSETHADRIAVAHNADDNVETFLLNLMRGAGIKGLRGMLPDTGEIIRPLLFVWRTEIIDYLQSIGQDFVVDSTNLESDFRRNFLRNKVLPLLMEEWPETKRSINKTISNLRSDEQILQHAAETMGLNEKGYLLYKDIRLSPDMLWLVRRFFIHYGGNDTQAGEALRCINSEGFVSGKKWEVDRGRIVAERDRLEFCAEFKQFQKTECYEVRMTEDLFDQIKQAPLTELWTDLPPEKLVFRSVHVGDHIKPMGMTGSSRVSKILKDAKLSASQKQRVIVAEHQATGEIIWIAGIKRSRLNTVTRQSKTVFRYLLPKTED